MDLLIWTPPAPIIAALVWGLITEIKNKRD
jgi:hypothetical protein